MTVRRGKPRKSPLSAKVCLAFGSRILRSIDASLRPTPSLRKLQAHLYPGAQADGGLGLNVLR